MKKKTFLALWNTHARAWHSDATVVYGDRPHRVSDLCSFADGCENYIYSEYEKIKKFAKEKYFAAHPSRINRYKRAAILVYAINRSPLFTPNSSIVSNKDIDLLFLKQKLAFYVALKSIIMDYPQNEIEQIIQKQGYIFDLDISSKGVGTKDSDTFLESIYKDIFFSKIYKNYNIITMSNVFLLLTERSSYLKGLAAEDAQGRDLNCASENMD